ncbi:hypothetical protein NW833_06750, partial [Synechococcus sp. O70.1]
TPQARGVPSPLQTPWGAGLGLAWPAPLQQKPPAPGAGGGGGGVLFQEGDPLDLLKLSPHERAAWMQAVWERHSQP